MNTDKIYAEQIANEYSKKSASKVIALKKLDRFVKRPAEIFTYTFGIAAILAAGTGMCLCMDVIGGGTTGSFVLGIAVGVLGFAGAGINYSLYRKILKKRREAYADDVIRLANEISREP